MGSLDPFRGGRDGCTVGVEERHDRLVHLLSGGGAGGVSQVDQLRACGSSVETVFPDKDSAHLFINPMDFSLRTSAARAGYDQGTILAEQTAEFWWSP